MLKFIKRLIVFFTIIILVDFLVGKVLQVLVKTASGGDTARNEYIANELDADVLIYGSSRCIHHYDPQIFEDSLGLSCYNCGQDGMGIILFYARYLMACERYIPKLIIYDPIYTFDLEKNDNSKYLSWLKMYYDKRGIDSIFWDIDSLERYKMHSHLYRYNGKILQILTDNLTNMREETKGYRPTDIVMSYDVEGKQEPSRYEVDTLKIKYLEKLIKVCKKNGTSLVFSLSPFYKGSKYTREDYAPILHLCNEYRIPFFDHFSDSDIVYEQANFEDSYHLNRMGATKYSKRLASELKVLIK